MQQEKAAGKRPEEVTMILKPVIKSQTIVIMSVNSLNEYEEEKYEQILTVANADPLDNNTWKYTFKGLPKYDKGGNVIGYELSEKLDNEASKYYVEEDRPETDDIIPPPEHYIITNTFKAPEEKIDIPVEKVWEDEDNKVMGR